MLASRIFWKFFVTQKLIIYFVSIQERTNANHCALLQLSVFSNFWLIFSDLKCQICSSENSIVR